MSRDLATLVRGDADIATSTGQEHHEHVLGIRVTFTVANRLIRHHEQQWAIECVATHRMGWSSSMWEISKDFYYNIYNYETITRHRTGASIHQVMLVVKSLTNAVPGRPRLPVESMKEQNFWPFTRLSNI